MNLKLTRQRLSCSLVEKPEFVLLLLFDQVSIETASEYNYMGIVFKYNNTLSSSLNRHLTSGNKSMFAILHRCYNMIDIQMEWFKKKC